MLCARSWRRVSMPCFHAGGSRKLRHSAGACAQLSSAPLVCTPEFAAERRGPCIFISFNLCQPVNPPIVKLQRRRSCSAAGSARGAACRPRTCASCGSSRRWRTRCDYEGLACGPVLLAACWPTRSKLGPAQGHGCLLRFAADAALPHSAQLAAHRSVHSAGDYSTLPLLCVCYFSADGR